jgi:hypothetical protein
LNGCQSDYADSIAWVTNPAGVYHAHVILKDLHLCTDEICTVLANKKLGRAREYDLSGQHIDQGFFTV